MTNAKFVWWNGKQRYGCIEDVHDGGGRVTFHKCNAVAKHDPDANGNPTKCGRHCAAKERKRSEQREANYQAYRAEMIAKEARYNLQVEAIGIIRRIAEGNNDPGELCRDFMKRYED